MKAGVELRKEGPLVGDYRISPNTKANGTDYQAVSTSGKTLFFTATPAGSAEVTIYARVDGGGPGAHTVVVSGQSKEKECTTTKLCKESEECTTVKCTGSKALALGQAGLALYQGASADGSKVFFTTKQELMNKDENAATDLYEYDLSTNKLILISDGTEGHETKGVVRTSSDGSHVYFVENGKLASEVEKPVTNQNLEGEEASEAGENLYGYDTVTKETKFVANASEGFGALVGKQTESIDKTRHAQTTPDGRYLVFSTPTKLVGDTNCKGTCAQAAYRYDFQTRELTWVSQAAPGYGTEGEGKDSFIAPLPGTLDGAEASINDWNRAVSEDGSYIIFTTGEKLQADDVNSAPDVYEWHAGEVHMISDGHDPFGVELNTNAPGTGVSGMSASGSDVFFLTHSPLVGQDNDVLGDLYDARVGGGLPAPVAEPSCSEDACQGPASQSPSFSSPTSSSFTAAGNLGPKSGVLGVTTPSSKPKPLTPAQVLANALKACKAKPKNKRASCESQARKRYKAQLLAKTLKACKAKPKNKRAACESQARRRYR